MQTKILSLLRERGKLTSAAIYESIKRDVEFPLTIQELTEMLEFLRLNDAIECDKMAWKLTPSVERLLHDREANERRSERRCHER